MITKKHPELTRKKALHFLKEMVRIRRLEEKSAELYTQEKIRGFLHLYIGQEAVATGVTDALKPEDAVVATYREHGHALAKGLSAGAIMAEMYGKAEGCSRGRGGSMHLFDKSLRFYGGNAIVGGGLPLAAGLALADKMQQSSQVTCCFFGEGAVAEGEFHETLNMASLWKLPVLFLCENNSYAMGTALKLSESETDISKKAAGYNIESAHVDGMNVLAVNEAAKEATDYIRRYSRPYFLECRTYRFRAHSMFDAELYREKSEVETWKQKDPILTFSTALIESELIDESDIKQIEAEVGQEIEQAVAFAERGTWEPVEELMRFVYSENSLANIS